MSKTSARLLKAAYIAKGYNTKSFAEALGMHVNTLYFKMSGKSDFFLDELLDIVRVLELEPEQIISIFFSEVVS